MHRSLRLYLFWDTYFSSFLPLKPPKWHYPNFLLEYQENEKTKKMNTIFLVFLDKCHFGDFKGRNGEKCFRNKYSLSDLWHTRKKIYNGAIP